jgi:hypothetical protein
VLVVQLAPNLVGAYLAFDFGLDRIEAAFQAANPQPCGSRGTGQPFRAQHQQGDEAHEHEFAEADTEH